MHHLCGADEFVAGFVEESRQAPVPPDSTLGQAMAEYRARVASGEAETVDPATWRVDPAPVED